MDSRSPLTEFGAEIKRVQDELVSMSKGGTLTRVFDHVKNREEDIEYFRAEMTKLFQNQMTGQQPVQVTVKNVCDLQKIIRERVDQVILSDPRVTEALEAIADPVQRAECTRDIAIAFANKLTAVVNTSARMAAQLSSGSVQEKNAKTYMEFVRKVNNLHDKTPEEAVRTIKKEAKDDLAALIQLQQRSNNVSFDSKDAGISIVKSGSPSVQKGKELHPSKLTSERSTIIRSSSLKSSTETAAAAATPPVSPSASPTTPAKTHKPAPPPTRSPRRGGP